MALTANGSMGPGGPGKARFGRRGVLAGAGAASLIALLSGAARTAKGAPIVSLAAGKVVGLVDDGVEAFLGIPYGGSTAGAWRYRAPRPVAPWKGLLDARRYGPIAPQAAAQVPADFQAILNYREYAAPGEDCLRLNVWTPQAEPGARRPVMVWFHGGGFTSGSGGIALYNGASLARRGDVVVVTINHRLASFGYLDLSWTGDPRFAESGNSGNLDLCLALRWVRDNIAPFGGDPSNVTIFGQSGGGAKVATVMAMPAAKGLFHKAIIQSGAKLRAREPGTAESDARAFLDALEIKSGEIDRLAQIPLETLYAAERSVAGASLAHWGPVVGGDALPSHPFDPVATALGADIPLLIGWTAEETSLFDAFLFRDPAFGALTPRQLIERSSGAYGDSAADMVAAYRNDYSGLSNWDLWLRMKADHFVGAASVRLAERKARQAPPVYVYRLDWKSPAGGGRLGAFHGLDQPLVFDNLARSPGWAGTGAAAQALADRMSSAWIAFARHGRPAAANLPDWPAFWGGGRATMLLDDHCRVVEDPAPNVRAAWAATGSATGL